MKKTIVLILISCFGLLLVSCSNKTTELTFYLLNEIEFEVLEGNTYNEPGFVATKDIDLSDNVEIISDLDITVPGIYTISYILTFEEVEYTLQRSVIVVDLLEEYFNQRSPGLFPVPFAPYTISTSSTSEFAGTYSADYKHYFFTRRNAYNINRLYYSEYVDGFWTSPSLSPISREVAEFEPHITPDNRYLYFGSKRDGNSSLVIFRSEMIDGVWNEPIYVDNGLNDGFAMYISVSNNQNIYYTTLDGIYVMRYIDGEYQAGIFTGIIGAHSFIAPDESYMLFDDSGGNNENTSIYITYNIDGEWSDPIILTSDINQDGMNQICASISPDGKFLFFSRFDTGAADIYWVNVEILDQYKPTN